MAQKLYLLINLGTPEAPAPQAIALFLKSFLSDPLVVDIPTIFRWFLVHVFIVPKHSKKIAQAYKSIWTDRGSPLRFHTEDLVHALQTVVEERTEVKWAMRYGEPNIETALKGVSPDTEIQVLPLYPQYALSSTQSSINELKAVVQKLKLKNKINFLPYFYQYDEFVSSSVDVFKKYVPSNWDHVLFSFHGLPLRHLTKLAPKGSPCSFQQSCCDQIDSGNRYCYRAQSYESARQIANQLGLTKDKYTVSFQSRLGRAKWIQPYTDVWLEEAAHRGIKNLVVVCPSFVADCLETLEEIKIRERKNFQKKGGELLTLIPCLNSEAYWVRAVHSLFTHHDKGWVSLGEGPIIN